MRKPNSDDDTALEEARRWAATVQARFAERYAGLIAQGPPAGPASIDAEHRAEMLRAVETGRGESLVMLEQLKRGSSAKLSELDEPGARLILEAIAADLQKTMAPFGLSLRGRELLISSLPSGLVSAFCCTSILDNRYHHVFVDSELIVFCSSLAKIVATCFTRGAVHGGKYDFASPQVLLNAAAADVTRRIEDMFAAMVFMGTVKGSKPWMPDAEAVPLQFRLTTAMQRFVMGHELSHLMLGHADADVESVRLAEETLADVDATIYSHQAEHEADLAGWILGMETAVRAGDANALSGAAAYVFLKGIEVLEACQPPEARDEGGIESMHPAAVVRLAVLSGAMRQYLAEKDPEGNLPMVLARLDEVFRSIRRTAVVGVAKRTAFGMRPRIREALRVFDPGERPEILSLRVDHERLQLVAGALGGGS